MHLAFLVSKGFPTKPQKVKPLAGDLQPVKIIYFLQIRGFVSGYFTGIYFKQIEAENRLSNLTLMFTNAEKP